MQSFTRKVSKFTTKRTEDKQDVSVILQEFKVADELLDHFMDAVRSFQNAWKGILAFQLGIAREFESIYSPKEDPESRFSADVDASAMHRATQWRSTYADLEKDLAQETDWIQTKLLNPAMDAKESIAPLKKVIKKRENYKLDYERYQARVDSSVQKTQKTQKDDPALAKFESDASGALALYQNSDDQLRRGIPPLVGAIQSLVPLLLNEQIMLQHTLVAQLYTVLHGFCQQSNYPSPAPPMAQVIATWESQFNPLRQEAESALNILANGKAVRQPMSGPEKPKTVTGLSIRSRLPGLRSSSQQSVPQVRRSSSNTLAIEDDEELPPPKPPRNGSASLSSSPRPRIGSIQSAQSVHSHQLVPEDEETPPPNQPRPGVGAVSGLGALHEQRRPSSSLCVNRSAIPSPAYGTPLGGVSPGLSEIIGRRSSASTVASVSDSATGRASPYPGDYFTQQRTASSTSLASSIAGKKKPPPPPVKRRVTAPDLVVTALYDFAGQGGGDLVFREGDRITVLKKTDSTDDWWVGSLAGVQGNFPANYVQLP